MKIRLVLVVIFVLGWGIETVLAQGFGRLRDRAVDAAARRVEQRIEQRLAHEIDQMVYRAVDRAFESAFGAPHKRSDFATDEEYDAAMEEWRMTMIMMGADAKVRDQYTFSVRSTMLIEETDYDGKKEDPVNYISWFEPGAGYSATTLPSEDGNEVVMVTDFENESIIMFVDGDDGKMSLVYSTRALESLIRAPAYDDDPEGEHDGFRGFEELGERTIHGLTASGYRAEDDEGITEFWVSREFSVEQRPGVGAGQIHQSAFAGFVLPVDGFMLKLTYKSHVSGESVRMEAVDLNRSASASFTQAEYPRISQ